MRHRGSRFRAVVATLLLALGAMFTAMGVASRVPSASDPFATPSSRSQEGAGARHDALAPRATSSSSKVGAHSQGPQLDLVAAVTALVAGFLLVGWFVAGRARRLLPRLTTAPLGARAPPALV